MLQVLPRPTGDRSHSFLVQLAELQLQKHMSNWGRFTLKSHFGRWLLVLFFFDGSWSLLRFHGTPHTE